MTLDFMGAIASNMGMFKDPDWIINVGDTVIKECVEWDFTDDEKDQSEIRVLLSNSDFINAGKFKYGMDMTIRFGYANEMSPEAYLPVVEIRRDYPGDKGMTIEVIGRDETSKLSGGNNRGNQGKGNDHKQLDQLLKANGLSLDGKSKGEDSDCKGSCYNESDKALIYRWANYLAEDIGAGGGGSGSGGPTSPLANEKTASGEGAGVDRQNSLTFDHSGDWIGNGKGVKRHENKGYNHGGQHSQAPITATLRLRGFPTLRAKRCLTIVGAGQEDNGLYYVKRVKHEYKGKGLLSTCELTRGGTGKGGVGGTPPIVVYADIWNRGKIYIGPKKTDSSSQATFNYGNDQFWMGLKVKEHPQKARAGGEPKKGMGLGPALKQRLNHWTTGEGNTKTELGGPTDAGSGGTPATGNIG